MATEKMQALLSALTGTGEDFEKFVKDARKQHKLAKVDLDSDSALLYREEKKAGYTLKGIYAFKPNPKKPDWRLVKYDDSLYIASITGLNNVRSVCACLVAGGFDFTQDVKSLSSQEELALIKELFKRLGAWQ